MPRRNGLGKIAAVVFVLAGVLILFAEECPARWTDTTRTDDRGIELVAAESCKDDGVCLEVYTSEGEIWARLKLAEDWGRGIDPSGQPTASVDNKTPLEPELYIVDGRELRFQIWDGRGKMPKQMRRWIKGRKVLVQFISTSGEVQEVEISLRGSSGAIKKVVRVVYEIQRGEREQ
jgi:hypothetical protein